MREIGGYFELERFKGKQYHEHAVLLNCGRACLKYLIELRKIKKIWLPDFMCDSVNKVFYEMNVEIKKYRINRLFLPDYNFKIKSDEWMLINDYYGQLKDSDIDFAYNYSNKHLICDETQSWFKKPCDGIDTIYSCRKWFGVSDGGVLVTNNSDRLGRKLEKDESHERMLFMLGRFETSASKYFKKSVENNMCFENAPVKEMSKITQNILRAIDYKYVAKRRRDNWNYLEKKIGKENKLKIDTPLVPFMYPFLVENSGRIREKMAQVGIYIPVLWPSVLEEEECSTIAYQYARNILPLPCDQRYGLEDMEYLINEMSYYLNNS